MGISGRSYSSIGRTKITKFKSMSCFPRAKITPDWWVKASFACALVDLKWQALESWKQFIKDACLWSFLTTIHYRLVMSLIGVNSQYRFQSRRYQKSRWSCKEFLTVSTWECMKESREFRGILCSTDQLNHLMLSTWCFTRCGSGGWILGCQIDQTVHFTCFFLFPFFFFLPSHSSGLPLVSINFFAKYFGYFMRFLFPREKLWSVYINIVIKILNIYMYIL